MSSGALSLLNSSGTPLTKTSPESRALDTRKLVCIRLSELKAKPLQPHPADLAVVTRHDPLDEVVHLVPIIALGERSSQSFWSDVKQGEMLLFDEPLSPFCRNDDSLTPLIIFNDQKSVGESGW